MNTIGCRLREERDRMGLNQTDFAELAGYSRNAQAHYERDERAPDANYLSALAAAGVDIMYVLTGSRVRQSNITNDEEKLIENYRTMDDAARLNMQAVSDSFAQSKTKKEVG
ncbi:transcriptional regulator [Photorhabdus sp. S8-52]|nr:transcriptional regulator [Photorhabdus sp. S9-53]RAX00958.1 transcriptional regulator [Photorhabdus sp. S10-54]RAX05298.1 transcriptional regulator [Photorhabdus sp. S8-52]